MIKRYSIEIEYNTDTNTWEVGGRNPDGSHYQCDMDDVAERQVPNVVHALVLEILASE